MKKLLAISLIVVAAIIITKPKVITIEAEKEIATIKFNQLSHRQEVWMYALEWCESRGNIEAINPKDKDGTPSYYSWQFKPGTFKGYGEKYGVIPKGLSSQEIMIKIKDYELQKQIVSFMIKDPSVKWANEFPDCVLRKIGMTPKD